MTPPSYDRAVDTHRASDMHARELPSTDWEWLGPWALTSSQDAEGWLYPTLDTETSPGQLLSSLLSGVASVVYMRLVDTLVAVL
jgi:hypothetical protein